MARLGQSVRLMVLFSLLLGSSMAAPLGEISRKSTVRWQ